MNIRPIHKLLVANRGEIAIRVMRTCREMGIATVAVYSEADRGSLHVEYADEAVFIGESAPARSYLNVERLLEAARRTGAEAIHPGYGFLSERSFFARAVIDAGFIWVGPSPLVIDLMGDKLAARVSMKDSGVPLVPGTVKPIADYREAETFALEHDFPILLKASAGGGGKGMRIVNERGQLAEAFERASSEAQKAFGDPSLFVERYISPARHIEIQVLGDSRGNCVHLGERECTLQRRFQKVVEESPSAFVSAEMYDAMGGAAAKAGKAIGYESAGTMEFVVDTKGRFYFLEMNTRLQVEHPVTELVTGVDIVREQLRIAMGHPISQWIMDAVARREFPRGHAIECRICAEDPCANFAPSAGRIDFMRVPSGPNVRVDSGVRAGNEISVYYDPMIAKLICHAPTREEARQHMLRALSEYEISGVENSVAFLRWLVGTDAFRTNAVHTRYIEETFKPEMVRLPARDPQAMAALAALLRDMQDDIAAPASTTQAGGTADGDTWRTAGRLASAVKVIP